MYNIVALAHSCVSLQDIETTNTFCISNYEDERKILFDTLKKQPELLEDVISIWGDTPIEKPDVQPFNQDINKLKKRKQTEIKHQCHNKISYAFRFDCGKGERNYYLSEQKQTDMKDLAALIKCGKNSVFWRDESRVMLEEYTAEEFMSLYNQGMFFIASCKLRSDGLEEYLNSLDDVEQISTVTWDTPLPEEIQKIIDEQLAFMSYKQ